MFLCINKAKLRLSDFICRIIYGQIISQHLHSYKIFGQGYNIYLQMYSIVTDIIRILL
jgi:hypothetical protein